MLKFASCTDYRVFASWKVEACRPPAIISAWMWDLKAPFASRPCDTVWHGFPWHEPVELQIFHQTQNLTYLTGAEGEDPIAAGWPHYLFFLSDLLLAYVKLWWTWAEHERLLYWLCDAAVGPDSAFDVLILSQWCQSTSAAVILPAGSTLRPVWKIDWQCLSKTHILSLVQVRDSWGVFFSSLSVSGRRAAYIDREWDFSVMQIGF